MLWNQHIKFYTRILLVIVIIGIGVLYYVSSREKLVPIKIESQKILYDIPAGNVKDNIRRGLQENELKIDKKDFKGVKTLKFDGSVYR